MNKNISVWRGNEAPPTNYHVWIKEDNNIYIYDGTNWVISSDDNYLNLINKPSIYHLGNFNNINDVYIEAARSEIYTDYRKNILTYTITNAFSSNVMSSGVIFQNHYNADHLDYRICTQYMLFDGSSRKCYIRTFNCNQLSDTTPNWSELKIYSNYVVENNALYGCTIENNDTNLTAKVKLFDFPNNINQSELQEINNTLNNKVDKVSGKQLSTEDFTTELKTKLNEVNTYKHYYTALSSMDFNQEAWFSVANIQDTESSIIQISTNGHTDVQLAVTTGWESPDNIQKQGGSLTVLNSFMEGANGYFAYVKGVRLRKENKQAKIEVLVNKPSSNDANKVSIVVSILTNANHNPLVINSNQKQTLQYVGSVNENTIVQSFNLEDKAIITKNLVAENIKLDGCFLEDVSTQMHCLQSNPNLDFDASGNDGNCYGYVGTLQNMNISEKSIVIDSISAYVREGSASPNLDTQVWCRLLRYTNNNWEIIYQSTRSKTIRGVLPETLFTFHMERVSDNYIINNTDKIAVTYVNSETAGVLSGVQLGFKTVNKQGGLLSALSNTSQGQSWSPALVFNYLPLSKAAISGDYNDLDNKPEIQITWDSSSNMNDFKTAGTYNIYGERTNTNDNLPISNASSGHSFRAQLFVLDSSLQPVVTEKCVTQILMLSNRKGHEGKMYIRTWNYNNAVSDGWSNWAEFSSVMTLGSGGMVDATTLDSTTSWGEYNGVLFDMNWVHGGSLGQMNNLMASIRNALTALSGGEIVTYMNELYFTTSSDDKGALKSNLFGAMFKLKVYDNDPVRNGLGAVIGNSDLANQMKEQLKRRIVQELDIVPFTFLPMAYIANYNQQPRVIRRYGDVDASGNVAWSKFYELDGIESIYQYQPTKFYGK